jgi:hypothetical protein
MRRAIAAPPAVLAVLLSIAAAAPAPLAAQAEFAVPVGRGLLRVNFTPDWLSYDHRFGLNVPGYANGSPVPIGLDFSAESLGVSSLPVLRPLQDQVRAASGLGAFTLNLGRSVVQLNASVRTLPIGLELGLSRRLSVGFTVPIVRSRVDASFLVDTNPAKRSNVAFSDTAAVSGFRTQVDAALAALQTQATSGPASLRDSARAALTRLQPFQSLAHAPLLPLNGSAAGTGVKTNLASAESTYAQLKAQYAAAGVTMPALNTLLTLPDSALARADLERFFSDTTLPTRADTLGTVVRTGIGDITAHATYQFAEGARYRGQIVVTTRLPTGKVPSASNFLDLGTGTHQLGVEAALANDVLIGSNFVIHAVARAGGAKADKLARRVTTPDLPMAPFSQLAMVNRSPGSYVALDLAPTWLLDDAFSVRVTYSYLNQGPTHYSYVDPADSLRVGMSAGVLDQETAMRAMRIGGGVTFATLSRYLAGTASLPYSLTVTYESTIWGRGGRVPQESIFRIQLRAYIRLFQ